MNKNLKLFLILTVASGAAAVIATTGPSLKSGFSWWELQRVTPSGYTYIGSWGEWYVCVNNSKCLNANLPEEKHCKEELKALQSYFPNEHFRCLNKSKMN